MIPLKSIGIKMFLTLACLTAVMSCGGGGSGGTVSQPPEITNPAFLDNGQVGRGFFPVTFTAYGTAPITWAVTGGSMPPGMSLNGSTGVYSGTPSVAGQFSFTVTASNSAGNSSKNYGQFISRGMHNVTEAEPNNDAASAQVIGVGETNYAGSIVDGSTSGSVVHLWLPDYDFYKFTVSVPVFTHVSAVLHFDTSTSSTDLNLYLYKNGSLISLSESTSSQSETVIDNSLEIGATYVLKIVPLKTDIGAIGGTPYRLTVIANE